MKEKIYEICEEMLANEEEAKKFANFETIEELYDYFLKKLPELTKDEFEEFICEVLDSYAKQKESVDKIDNDGLGEVSGGAFNLRTKITSGVLAFLAAASVVPGMKAANVNDAVTSQSISQTKSIKTKISDAFGRVKAWVKAHPGLTAGIGLGTLVLGGTAIALGVRHSRKSKDSKAGDSASKVGATVVAETHTNDDETKKQAEEEATKQAEEERKKAEAKKKDEEEKKKKAEEEERKKKAEEEKKKAEEEKKNAEEEKKKGEEEKKKKAEEEKKKAEEEKKKKAEEEKKKAEEEKAIKIKDCMSKIMEARQKVTMMKGSLKDALDQVKNGGDISRVRKLLVDGDINKNLGEVTKLKEEISKYGASEKDMEQVRNAFMELEGYTKYSHLMKDLEYYEEVTKFIKSAEEWFNEVDDLNKDLDGHSKFADLVSGKIIYKFNDINDRYTAFEKSKNLHWCENVFSLIESTRKSLALKCFEKLANALEMYNKGNNYEKWARKEQNKQNVERLGKTISDLYAILSKLYNKDELSKHVEKINAVIPNAVSTGLFGLGFWGL